MAGVKQSLLDSWEEAGSPELATEEEPVEDELPLEGDNEPDELPLEAESSEEPQSSESGTAEEAILPDGVPENYFGKDLKEYARQNGPEATTAYYDALQDATRDYNRRLEELAEERKALQTQQTPQSQQQVDVAGEQDVYKILREFGVNLDNPYAEEIKDDVLVPMAQVLSEIRGTQQTQTSQSEAQAWEQQFNTALDGLETKFGTLPGERQSVLEFAIDQDIYSPQALYWTIMGPVQRAEASSKVSEADTAKRAADETVKRVKKSASRQKGRRSSTASATQKPTNPKTMLEAAQKAARDLGYTSVRMEER